MNKNSSLVDIVILELLEIVAYIWLALHKSYVSWSSQKYLGENPSSLESSQFISHNSS